MKNSEINIRDPFVMFEDGKYYMYGSERPVFFEMEETDNGLKIKK